MRRVNPSRKRQASLPGARTCRRGFSRRGLIQETTVLVKERNSSASSPVSRYGLYAGRREGKDQGDPQHRDDEDGRQTVQMLCRLPLTNLVRDVHTRLIPTVIGEVGRIGSNMRVDGRFHRAGCRRGRVEPLHRNPASRKQGRSQPDPGQQQDQHAHERPVAVATKEKGGHHRKFRESGDALCNTESTSRQPVSQNRMLHSGSFGKSTRLSPWG